MCPEGFRNSPKGVPDVSRNVWAREHFIWAKGESPRGFWKVQKEVLWRPDARRQEPWHLASGLRKTSFCTSQKPCGLSPLAQITCSRTQTFRKTSGTLPEIKHYYPIYKTLSLDHSGVPRHVHDLIWDSEQHLVTNIIIQLYQKRHRTLSTSQSYNPKC